MLDMHGKGVAGVPCSLRHGSVYSGGALFTKRLVQRCSMRVPERLLTTSKRVSFWTVFVDRT